MRLFSQAFRPSVLSLSWGRDPAQAGSRPRTLRRSVPACLLTLLLATPLLSAQLEPAQSFPPFPGSLPQAERAKLVNPPPPPGGSNLDDLANYPLPKPAPDAANPFLLDEKSRPVPLVWPSSPRPKIETGIHFISFDGVGTLEMNISGPDFEITIEPLVDWMPAPPSALESVALVYRVNTQLRLGFTLFGPKEFLPNLQAPALARYLALMRESNPKAFVLITPFPPEADAVNGIGFGQFSGAYVDYETVQGDPKDRNAITGHRDYFMDLHGYYTLLIRLSGPAALVEKVKPELQLHFARNSLKRGLGLKSADDAKPAAEAPPPSTPAEIPASPAPAAPAPATPAATPAAAPAPTAAPGG